MSCGRCARFSLFLVLAAVCLVPGKAGAQTTVVSNPTTLVFTPSADHNTVYSDGQQAVVHYDFNVYAVGASQPFQSTDIGKPAPAADGLIYYDFSSTVASWPLPGGDYESRVAASGPLGTGLSAPSNEFTFGSSCSYAISPSSASVPASGGGTQVSVATGASCTWSASSNASWVTLSSASGTGNASIVATVAANTTSSARQATVTVAGQPFTISEASTTTTSGTAPTAPANPSPGDGAGNAGLTPTLQWTDTGATMYTVRFGTVDPPPQAATGLTATSYTPGTLTAATTYYWQVIAVNGVGTTQGPIWSFSTSRRGKKK